MKRYTIEIEDTVSKFFEEISIIANRPVEDILSDGLFKQVEIIKRCIAESFNIEDED